MKEIKVSVVVPVYNAAPYLDRSIGCIVNQTLKDIEIICVNDGSTDGSLGILREFEKNDPRFRIIDQPNSGAALARNTGLAEASGEYIIFWDADDFFELTALEELYEKSKKDDADICICGYMKYWEDEGKVRQYEVHPKTALLPVTMPFNIRSCPDHILDFTHGIIWNKLFRRSFVREKQFLFPDKTADEDVYFVDMALCTAERITILDKILIYYCDVNPNSLVKKLGREVGTGLIDSYLQRRELLKANSIFPEQSFANRAFRAMLIHLRRDHYSWQTYEEFFYRLKNSDFEKLGIIPYKPGYIYDPWQENLLIHWLQEKPEEFLFTYIAALDKQNKSIMASKYEMRQKYEKLFGIDPRLIAVYKKLNRLLRELKVSKTNKISSVITWLPRKLLKR